MPPLWISIIIGVAGLGVLNRFIRWLFPRLAAWASVISAVTLVLLITAAQKIVEYPTTPRELRLWQREALALNLPTVPPVPGRITFFVCTAEGALEAQDYSRKFMNIFSAHDLSAAYGCDPAWNHIVVNQKKVIVAPDNDVFLRVRGVELWVLDPKQPSLAATQMKRALAAAGILAVWKPDIRLAGIEAYDRYRFPINGPQCVIMIGSKPPWSWRAFLSTEQQFFRFRSQHPPDTNWVMYQALWAYVLLIFFAPLALVFLRARAFIVPALKSHRLSRAVYRAKSTTRVVRRRPQ
jgi:hypothetical protein